MVISKGPPFLGTRSAPSSSSIRDGALLSGEQPIIVPTYLYTYILVYLYTCIPIYLYTCIPIYLYNCLYAYIPIYLGAPPVAGRASRRAGGPSLEDEQGPLPPRRPDDCRLVKLRLVTNSLIADNTAWYLTLICNTYIICHISYNIHRSQGPLPPRKPAGAVGEGVANGAGQWNVSLCRMF